MHQARLCRPTGPRPHRFLRRVAEGGTGRRPHARPAVARRRRSRPLNAVQKLLTNPGASSGAPGPPPNDVDVLVVGSLDRADVYDAADRAQARLGMQVNPVIRSSDEWAADVDPLVLQIKASPTVDVTTTRKVAS